MKHNIKKLIYNIIVIIILLCAAAYICSRFIHLGNVAYTDNAQVRRHITHVNCRIQGFVKEVRFTDYQQVRKGDTLVLIEDAEYSLRLAQAMADYANAQAALNAAGAGISTTENNLSVNDASIEEARAQLDNAQKDFTRFESLYEEGAVTKQEYDRAKTTYDSAKARYDYVMRAKRSTSLTKTEQTLRLEQNRAAIALTEAALNLARLNLSYTVITAPCDGTTGRKAIHEGELMQPGQTVVDLVDDGDIYITANYRETQLPKISVGAEVEVKADAVPGVKFKGRVESIAEATGAAFSMIPQDNATGNFVKIEQRVPVRIVLDENQDLTSLRAGLNVECEIKY